MKARAMILITMIAGVVFVLITLRPNPVPALVWNASESAPIGLYRIRSLGELAVGDLVIAFPDEPLAAFLADRGYLPRGVPLIKHVVALPGQTVCRAGLAITADSVPLGAAREQDRHGRPLPAWHGCKTIAEGEVFLMNSNEPESLDGRYFGPVARAAIVGQAEPLWTFEGE